MKVMNVHGLLGSLKAKIVRGSVGHTPLDASTGQNGVVQAREFCERVGVTGVVLTKLDGTARGGVAVAVERRLGIPIKLVGTGEGLSDLAVFDAETFVGALLEDEPT